MAAIRELPIGWIVVCSAIGCVLRRLLHLKLTETVWSPGALYVTLFIGLSVLQISIFAVYAVFIYPFFLSPFRDLPSPTGGSPFFGHGREFTKQGPGYLSRQWFAETDDDGLMRFLWHGNQEMLVVRSQHALAEILVKKSYEFEKPEFLRGVLSVIIGWALLTTEGEEHKRQRRNMLPAFSFRHIKDLYPLFWSKACEGVAAMTTICQQKANAMTGVADMELASWATRSGLDIIGIAAAGIDFGAVKDANNPLAQSYYHLNPSTADITLIALRAFLPQWLMEALPLPRIREVKRAAGQIRKVCQDLIQEKKTRLANKEDIGFDILSVALAGGLFSDKVLVDQMLTFFTAGHETTAASLVWAIYLLTIHPHIQERLRAEIREHLPSPDSETSSITSRDIDSLPYLNAVCNEVLRTHSPVPATARVANCNTTVQGQYIPRGTLLLIPIWAINTDRLLWGPDADEFKPERWLSPEQGGTSSSNAASGGATSNYAFMTFIHGPHSCIGGSFSKAEMACLLATWIGRFSFELQDASLMDSRNMKIPPSPVAKPEGGLHMRVRAMEGW